MGQFLRRVEPLQWTDPRWLSQKERAMREGFTPPQTDSERTDEALRGIEGKRLTYHQANSPVNA